MNGPGTRRGAFLAAYPELADAARLAFDELDRASEAERSGATKRQRDAAGRFAQRLESDGLYVGHIRLRYGVRRGRPADALLRLERVLDELLGGVAGQEPAEVRRWVAKLSPSLCEGEHASARRQRTRARDRRRKA